MGVDCRSSIASTVSCSFQPVPTIAAVKQFESANGLEIAIEGRQCDVLCATIGFRIGASSETPELAGVSHLLEHVLVHWLKRRGMELRCGPLLINGRTTFYSTSISIVALPHEITFVLDLLSGLWVFPVLSERDLGTEVDVVLSEIGARKEKPDIIYARQVLAELLGKRFGLPIEGHGTSLRSLTVSQLEEHYRHFRPWNAVLSLVGSFDPDKLAHRLLTDCDFLQAAFGGSRVISESGFYPPVNSGPVGNPVRQVDKVATQPGLAIAIPSVLHRDRPVLELLSYLLNHCDPYTTVRNEDQMQWRKLKWRTRIIDMGPFPTLMVLKPSSSSNTESKAYSLLGTAQELASAIVGSTPEAVLAGLKRRIHVDWLFEQQKPEMRAATLCSNRLLGHWSLGDILVERITRTSRAKLEGVLSKYLVPERLVIPRAHSNSPIDHAGVGRAAARTWGTSCRSRHRGVRNKSTHSRQEPGPDEQVLANAGLNVVHGYELQVGIAVIAVFFVRSVSVNVKERKVSGLASLVLEKELLSRQGSQGPRVTSFTSKDVAGLIIEGPRSELRDVLEQLLDLLSEPSLSEESFTSAKRQRIAYLRSRSGECSIMCLEELEKQAFQGTPYEYPTYGTVEQLLTLEYEDMQQHYETLRAKRVIVSVAGNIDDLDLQRDVGFEPGCSNGNSPDYTMLSQLGLSRRRSPVPSAYLVRGIGHQATLYCLGFPIPALADPEHARLSLLNLRLAGSSTGLSVLWRKLREYCSCYGVHSSLTQYRHRNLLWIQYLVSGNWDREFSECVNLVTKELSSLSDTISKEDLYKLKKLWIRQYKRSVQGIVAKATTRGYHELNGLGKDFSVRFAKQVADTELPQLRKTAEHYLVLNPDNLAIYNLRSKGRCYESL
jgi:zinc protease